MTTLRFVAMPTDQARTDQHGEPDASGPVPQPRIGDGDHLACRHGLDEAAAGDPYLVLACRPFPALQPNAECGPIFLHARPCDRHAGASASPHMFRDWLTLLIRGGDERHPIGCGSGGQVSAGGPADAAAAVLAGAACVPVRSAPYNGLPCRSGRTE